MTDDQRLIEDYIPIEAISAESRREKSIRKGHISTLHLWWARRPLVASRAAVYGALVPAPQGKRAAQETQQFVAELCQYPGSRRTVRQAQQNILAAHAERLSQERGELVTAADIEAGRAPRPRVLDMFAGGGAIPLEALRLGCEAYALDLNPVAHIIQLCTLVYPQQYGQPDAAAVGSAADGSWAGLAQEVEHWGNWVLEQVQAEIGDLYPPIPDPRQPEPAEGKQLPIDLVTKESQASYNAQTDMLTPIAFLWTRTVQCKNPNCAGTVPLARQTWLAKKEGRYIALRPDIQINQNKSPGEKKVVYHVVEAKTAKGLGFNPSGGSRRGNVPCLFCGTVADNDYIKASGQAKNLGSQPMGLVCIDSNNQKVFLADHDVPASCWGNESTFSRRIDDIKNVSFSQPYGPLPLLDEPILGKLSDQLPSYGMETFQDIFLPRQMLMLLTFVKYVRFAYAEIVQRNVTEERARAIVAYLASNSKYRVSRIILGG
jgi:putative DNA methylase